MNRNRKKTLQKTLGVSQRACALVLSAAMAVPAGVVPAYAGQTQVQSGAVRSAGGYAFRSIGGPEEFEAREIVNTAFQYSGTNFSHVAENGTIEMHIKLIAGEGFSADVFATNEEKDTYAGNYLLEFSDEKFYQNIEGITLSGDLVTGGAAEFTGENDGALWKLPVSNFGLNDGANRAYYDVKIRLSGEQTLETLGLSDKKLEYTVYFIRKDGLIDKGGYRNGFIFQKNPQNLESSAAGADFLTGQMFHHVKRGLNDKAIYSHHAVSVSGNWDEIDPYWTFSIEERIPEELVPLLKDKVKIYAAEDTGSSLHRQQFFVSLGKDGILSTRLDETLGLQGKTTSNELETVRTAVNEIFQSQKNGASQGIHYMTAYEFKDGVTMSALGKAIRDYEKRTASKNMMFESWIAVDYLDECADDTNVETDGGAENQMLAGSYTTDFFEFGDADKDGLFDLEERELKTDVNNVDSDGDGVPDGQEVEEDNTNPNDTKSYKVQPPKLNEQNAIAMESGKLIIQGSTPKKLHPDPKNPREYLRAKEEAGGVIVELYAADESGDPIGKSIGTTTIPYAKLESGAFSLELEEEAYEKLKGRSVVLVAKSPDGENPAVSEAFLLQTMKDEKEPISKPEEIKTGQKFDLTDNIINLDELPKDSDGNRPKVEDVTEEGTINVNEPGEYAGQVKVTYSDGSSIVVNVPVVVSPWDKDVYEAKGGELEKEYGDTATKGEIADQVIVTPDKENIVVSKEVVGEIPSSGKDHEITVTVTYKDGSSENATVILSYKDASETYNPEGKDITVVEGGEAKAEDAIANKDALPKDTEYEWKEKIDTSTPGEKAGTVVVSYPDGSQDEVEVNITVTRKETEADKYEATDGILNVPYDASYKNDPDAFKFAIKSQTATTAEKGTYKFWVRLSNENLPKEGKGNRVPVRYQYKADKSIDDVEVIVNFLSASETFEPKVKEETVEVGGRVDLTDNVTNRGELPEGTKVTDVTPEGTIDTSKEGEYTGKIEITYPDGSKDTVDVPVTVEKPEKPDNETYKVFGSIINVPYGTKLTKEEIKSAAETTAPQDKVKGKWVKEDVPTSGTGNQLTVEFTYADGTKNEAIVTVNFGKAAELYNPEGRDIETVINGKPKPKKGIANKAELPEGTKYKWKEPVDTSKAGDHTGVIIVTYPDSSEDEVTVNINVTDNRDDADIHEPVGKDVDVELGAEPKAEDAIDNKTELPDGTQYEWERPIDTSKEGMTEGTVIVTYPDGTSEAVVVTIHVVEKEKDDADKYEAQTEPETVKPGGTIDLTDNVINMDDLPAGTRVVDITEPKIDTNKPGDYTGKVEIIYPDGSREEVEIEITVTEKTMAELFKPKTKKEVIFEGEDYKLTDNVTNLKKLPEGVKIKEIIDITPEGQIDNNKKGKYTGRIEIIFEDGSKIEKNVIVQVKKKPKDSKKYGKLVHIEQEIIYVGENPDFEDHINFDELPVFTDWKDESAYGEGRGEIDINRPGSYKAKIRIIFPDGSSIVKPATVVVLRDGEIATPSTPSVATPSTPSTPDPEDRTQAEKYNPLPNPIEIEKGEEIDPEDGIRNKDKLPEGTEYIDATPESVDKSKDFEATIIVRYLDSSEDTVKVPVTVKDNGKDDDKDDGKNDGKDDGKDDNHGGSDSNHGGSGNPGSSGGSGSSGSSGGHGSAYVPGGSNDTIYANPDRSVTRGSVGGAWKLIDAENHKWIYTTAAGAQARGGWMFIGNPYAKDEAGRFSWFKFNQDGIMEFGWIKSQNGKWYHTHAVSDGNLGILGKGWYHEVMDDRWYYLDEQTGEMQVGWTTVNGKAYYFTEEELVPQQTYFQKEDGYWYYDNEGRRPYGSMYQNEAAPDGRMVGQDGVRIG